MFVFVTTGSGTVEVGATGVVASVEGVSTGSDVEVVVCTTVGVEMTGVGSETATAGAW